MIQISSDTLIRMHSKVEGALSDYLYDAHNDTLCHTSDDWELRKPFVKKTSRCSSPRDEWELSSDVFYGELSEELRRLYFALLALPDNEDVPTAAHDVFGGRGILVLSREQELYFLDNRPAGVLPSQVYEMLGRIRKMYGWYTDSTTYPEPTDAEVAAHTAYCSYFLAAVKEDPRVAAMFAEFIAYANPIRDGCKGIFAIWGREGETVVRGIVQVVLDAVAAKKIEVVGDDHGIYYLKVPSAKRVRVE